MRKPPVPTPALALIAGAALAGCGSSSSDYPAAADNICKTYNAKINKLAKPASDAQVAPYLAKISPIFHQAAGQLRAVKPPSDKKAAYQRYVAIIDQESSVLARAGSAKTASQAIATIQAVQQTIPAQLRLQAKAAGLKHCAQ